jgi:methyltransferase-like protein
MRSWGDSYLRHESLEDVNEPLYFHEFVAKAKTHNLRYLGEAEFHTMLVGNLAPTVAATLERLAADQIDMEQYMDFVRNRTFRQTLLCHSQVNLDRNVAVERLAELHVASPLKPTNPQTNLQSDESEGFLHGPSGNVVTAHRSILKAALLVLSEIWPNSMAFQELVARAQERSTGGGEQVTLKQDRIAVGELLLRCYAKNLLVLHVHPPRLAASVSPRPVASPLARLQARGDGAITTQRHDQVPLDGTHRRLLSLLDGTRDRDALVDQLTEHTLKGNLKLKQGGETITNATRIRDLIADEIPPCLQRLAQNALLIG